MSQFQVWKIFAKDSKMLVSTRPTISLKVCSTAKTKQSLWVRRWFPTTKSTNLPQKLLNFSLNIVHRFCIHRWQANGRMSSMQIWWHRSGRWHRRFSEISFHIHTNRMRQYDLNGGIDVMRPKLVDGSIEFPVTQVGHGLIKFIDVCNAANMLGNETIMVHYSIHNANENRVGVELPPEVINECWNGLLTPDSLFTLAEPEAQLLPISIITSHSTIQHAAVAKASKETEKSSSSNGLNYRNANQLM